MKSIITIVVLIVVAIIGFTFLGGSSDEPEATVSPVTSPTASPGATGDQMEDEMMEEGEVKVFQVSGVKFAFDVEEIRVKEGDKVRIEFISNEGLHDWTVSEFGAATDQVNTGGSTSVEFIADQKGTFEYFCSVSNHRQLGMVGNLIVE